MTINFKSSLTEFMKYDESKNAIIMTPSKKDVGQYEINIELSDESGKKSSTLAFNIELVSNIDENMEGLENEDA